MSNDTRVSSIKDSVNLGLADDICNCEGCETRAEARVRVVSQDLKEGEVIKPIAP